MDLAYWGFHRWPFERSFALDRFFASRAHEEALARLLFLVEESRRSGVMSGATGTGKTFLLRQLQQRADRLGRLTVYCNATGLSGSELISQIATSCHVHCDVDASPARIWNALQARFAALAIVHQPIVVLLDHFDLVEISTQQTVCRLHQLADTVGVKLTIILATRTHNVPELLREFVDLKIDIPSWTADECSRFINTSVFEAGGQAPLFTDEAIASVYESTFGVPARVVSLCNLTLLAAMGSEERLIQQDIVDAVANEMTPRIDDHRTKTGHSVGKMVAVSSLE